MSALTIILMAAASMVALGVVAIATWFFYTAYLTRLERRLAVRKGLYRDLVAGLAQSERELLNPAILRAGTLYDLEALEAVLEEQARSSTDRPAWLLDAYDRLALVDKYIERLRRARRWRERAFAAELLGRVGSAKAVPVLLDTVQATRTEDADVRDIALRALARIADPRAVGPLIEALRTSEVWLAPRIADILSRHGDLVVDPLIAFLEEPGRQPGRAWAANILGDVGAKRAFPVLVRTLGDLEDEVRGKAATSLGRLGDGRAVPYLLEHLLTDPAPFVRARIAGALGQFGDPDVIDRLVRALGDPAWWVRMRSVEALEQVGDAAEPALLVALDDPDHEIRSRSAIALERLGFLQRLLGTIDAAGPGDADEVLLKFAVAGARELLAELLVHASPAVRAATVRAAQRAGRADLAPELIRTAGADRDPTVRAGALDAIRALGLRDGVPAALTALVDPAEPVRTAAIRVLGELGGADVGPPLRLRTADPEPAVRATAARALGATRDRGAVDEFRRLLADPDQRVRAAAAAAVGEAGARALSDELIPLLGDTGSAVRVAAAGAIARTGGEGSVPALLRAFRDGDAALREAIVGAVAQLQPDAVRSLLDILVTGHDSASKLALIRALVMLKADAPLPLIGPLSQDPEPAVRIAAVGALGTLGTAGAAPYVADALEDPDEGVRAAAADAVFRLQLSDQAPALLDMLAHDPSALVRERSALAIGLLGAPGGAAALVAASGSGQPAALRAAAVLALGASEGETMLGRIGTMMDEGDVRALLQARLRDDPEYRLLGLRLRQSHSLELRALSASSREGVQAELAEGMRSTLEAPERVRLVAALTAFQGERSRDSLLGLLRGDPSAEVRAAALAAVVPMLEGDALLGAARAAVTDPSLLVRRAGIALLDRTDPAATLPAILRALRSDEDPAALADAAGRSEASFGAFETVARELMADERRVPVLVRLAAGMHHAGLAPLLHPLSESTSPVARATLAQLWVTRPDLADGRRLGALARDPVTAVRRQAARAAAAAGRYDVIATMLGDPDADTRRGIALLLVAAPGGEGLDELAADGDARVRAAVGVARILRGDADALPADVTPADAAEAVVDAGTLAELREAARSAPDERRRLAAGLALALVRDSVATDVVRTDPVPYVRGRVAAMLEWAGGA